MIIAIINGDERLEDVQNVMITENDVAIIEYLGEFGSTRFSTPINKLELIKEDPIKMEQYFRDCDYLKEEEKYDMCFQCYRYNTCIKDYEKAKKRGFKK